MTEPSAGTRHARLARWAALPVASLLLAGCAAAGPSAPAPIPPDRAHTGTPIKHVVVLFDENISFDHYFGTYPHAANTDGTPFTPLPGTPEVNGLTPALLTRNPNVHNPVRLTPAQALTCDQHHDYDKEQRAYDNGAVDKFVQNTETDTCTGQPVIYGVPGLVMGYYDGNTVTALWNYAQHFAMSDNFYGSNYGPSTPGALNLVAGNTHGSRTWNARTGAQFDDPSYLASPDPAGVGTLIQDPDPKNDECSDTNHTTFATLGDDTGRNIGDLLNEHRVSWGWFQGGFAPTSTDAGGKAVCGAEHANVGGIQELDYSPHHNPFQYFASTANPKHLPPSSVAAIGRTDQANHNYDLSDFDAALAAGNLPSVSYLKAGEYQDAHAGYSSPLDEQRFLVTEINKIERSPLWSSTAIFIAYDDSDGWYDHVMPPLLNGSNDPRWDSTPCTTAPALDGQFGRCGAGPRLPLLAISPYSRSNYVDHGLGTQASILRFVEDNWGLGRLGGGSYDASAPTLLRPDGLFDFTAPPRLVPVLLDPNTGVPTG